MDIQDEDLKENDRSICYKLSKSKPTTNTQLISLNNFRRKKFKMKLLLFGFSGYGIGLANRATKNDATTLTITKYPKNLFHTWQA